MFLKKLKFIIANAVVMFPILSLVMMIHEGMHALLMLAQEVPIESVTLGMPAGPMIELGEIQYVSGDYQDSFSLKLSPMLFMAGVEPGVDYLAIPPEKGILIVLIGPLVNLALGLGLLKLGMDDTVETTRIWGFWDHVRDYGFFQAFVSMFIFWNFNLGVLNILPIPPLDGGKAVLALGAIITGSQVSENLFLTTSLAGMGLFLFFWFRNIREIFRFKVE